MFRAIRWVVAAVLLAPTAAWAADAYFVKVADSALPKELKEPIAKLLGDSAVQLLDAKGALIGEFWFRKELPAKATPAQVKNGLTYRELEETLVLGAVRFAQPVTDFRKQKLNAGVYTVRLAFQPMDGDHMGTSPHPEFALLSPAAMDEHAEPFKGAKELHELSARSVAGNGSHPAVFLLVPVKKAEETPKLADAGSGHWVLNVKEAVAVGKEKTSLGIGLTVVGHAE